MAAPVAALPRTTTVTLANPTPPTNVVAQYQGTPPTLPGLVPPTTGGITGAPPILTDAALALFADPLEGAVATAFQNGMWPAADGNKPVVYTPVTELAGKAEGDGTEAVLYWPVPGTTTAANATTGMVSTDGNYSETPNASHPSYGT